MKISVIIPVYNAGKFVRQSVESALDQKETGEVVLIEDGSTDNSLEVCTQLENEYSKVRLIRHLGGKNRGAGASRNIGLKNASYEIISFLDADDYFLENRFASTKEILKEDLDADGVYEAVGYYFEKEKFRPIVDDTLLTTMRKRIEPEYLFEMMSPIGPEGYCPTDGWTVRRNAFGKTGLFDERLELHQDTEIFARLAAICRILPGTLDKPVAMRRVHGGNRISAPRSEHRIFKDRIKMWGILWLWSKKNLNSDRQDILFSKLIGRAKRKEKSLTSPLSRRVVSLYRLLVTAGMFPTLLNEKMMYKEIWLSCRACVEILFDELFGRG